MVSQLDLVRIAAQAIVSPRTVFRVYSGAGSEYSRRRVTEGARALGLPPPASTVYSVPPVSEPPKP